MNSHDSQSHVKGDPPPGLFRDRLTSVLTLIIRPMTVDRNFERGQHVVWRSRPRGVVGFTLPAIVVEDSKAAIALFQPTGTVMKQRSGVRGGPRGRNLVQWDGTHVDFTYDRPSSLRLHVPGTGFEVIRHWTGTGFKWWYINLVDPWTRTQLGFDSCDLTLDIVTDPEMSTWKWKDEDEFAWRIERGDFDSAEAERIRAEGLRAVQLMEARSFPFVEEEWGRFHPDEAWSTPVLPADWYVIV